MFSAEKAILDTEIFRKINIEKLISEAVQEGERFCDFAKAKLKDRDIQELKDLGFRVEERKGDVMFRDFYYYRVLW